MGSLTSGPVVGLGAGQSSKAWFVDGPLFDRLLVTDLRDSLLHSPGRGLEREASSPGAWVDAPAPVFRPGPTAAEWILLVSASFCLLLAAFGG